MKEIDYDRILENTRSIINTMEWDCMRSGGKVKYNVESLNALYALEKNLAERTKKPAKKPTPAKEG